MHKSDRNHHDEATNKVASALPLWFPTTFLFFHLDIFIIDGVAIDALNLTLRGLLNPPASRFFQFFSMNFTLPVCLCVFDSLADPSGFTWFYPRFQTQTTLCSSVIISLFSLSLSLDSLVSQSLLRAFRRWSTTTRYVLKVRPDYTSQVGLLGWGGGVVHCLFTARKTITREEMGAWEGLSLLWEKEAKTVKETSV